MGNANRGSQQAEQTKTDTYVACFHGATTQASGFFAINSNTALPDSGRWVLFVEKVSRKGKVPYRVALKWNLPFAFAAIWRLENQAPSPTYSCAMLTTDANETLRPIHATMPIILPMESEKPWLSPDLPVEAILQMLKPYPGELMNFFPVTTKINSPDFNSPLLLEPAQPTDQFGNYMLFDT